MSEEDLPLMIHDDDDGITLEIFVAPGVGITVSMEDDVAQEMIDIMQNKLNARFTPDV